MHTGLIFHNPANRRLILLFSGWSTVPGFYTGLRAEGWDIMLVSDYSDPSFDISRILDYATVYIVAWSLGVAAAELAARISPLADRVSAAFAVNGTLSPADDMEGIPEAIYDATRENLSPASLRKFRRRMSSRRDPHSFPADTPFSMPDESEEEAVTRLRRELLLLRERHDAPRLNWKRAYISLNDLIFPPENQSRAWARRAPHTLTVEIPSGHYLPLQEIIDAVTPDHSRISRRFSRAAATYEANASAQGTIARRLASMLPEAAAAPDAADAADAAAELLEIGAGSGALTRALAERLTFSRATFIDLYPLRRFGVAPEEEYVVADAEEWMERVPDDSFSLIASASTIQWFADPARFFANAARVLRPGGTLLCSTFLPGNLAELDALRPSPLIYRHRDELTAMLRPLFGNIRMQEEEISLRFASPREALMHLKLTGVGGGTAATARHLLTALPPHPTLTYRTLCILATEPHAGRPAGTHAPVAAK